jgi:hypothetical protein
MFCSVPDACQTFESTISTRVHYTPEPADMAHADLTFRGSADSTEEVFEKLRLWLCDVVTGLYPAQIQKLLPRGQTPSRAYACD